MTDETPTATPVADETTPTVTFSENEDGTVTASFPSMNGAKPFEVTLQNMTWGLIADIENMGTETSSKAILAFFEEYIKGGPSAVPFAHTLTVFNAIRAYIEYTSSAAKND